MNASRWISTLLFASVGFAMLTCSTTKRTAGPSSGGGASGGSPTGAAGTATGGSGPGAGGTGQGGSPAGTAGTGTVGAGGAAGSAGPGADAAAGMGGGGAPTPDSGSDATGQTEVGSRARQWKCPAGPFPAPKAGAAQAICGDFTFKYDWNEGPTWIESQGAFFFSNFVRGAAGPGDIIKYTPGGSCETFITNVACNGLTAAYDGSLTAVCQGERALMAFDVVTKQPTTLAGMYGTKLLDSPNDVVAHSNGTIYFTNPTYELGNRPVGVGQAVFRLDPTRQLQLIAMENDQPNGIALSPDESTLYVELDGSGVKTYSLDAQGVPTSAPKAFSGGTDGMSVDCAGNVYLSGGQIIGPSGMQVGSFPGGTMAAFGGADGMTLIVVGQGTGLHLVPMNIPGAAH
jgi:gluconolactonase